MKHKSESTDESTIGEIFKTARENSHITIEEIATILKIKPRDLLALEEDNFLTSSKNTNFKSKPYLYGLIRSYAKLLRIDEKIITEKIKELSSPVTIYDKKYQLLGFDEQDQKSANTQTFFNAILVFIILSLLLFSFHYFRSGDLITTEFISNKLNNL